MEVRRLLGWLCAAALALCVGMGCKDTGGAKIPPSTAAALDKGCEQLAIACADKDKHLDKMVAECKQAAKKHVENGCTDKALALYDCYAKQLCGSGDKVWALDDFRVLAERHTKCVAEQTASKQCAAK